MIYVIAYDIADNHRRESVSALLATCGARVQFSVFECELPNPVAFTRMRDGLAAIIDTAEDQVRLYPLPDNAERRLEVLGDRRLEERQDYWIL